MKPSISMIAALLFGCATLHAAPIPRDRLPSNCPSPSEATQFYRLFQNDIEHYLYTTSSDVSTRALDAGYEFDGVAARVFQTAQASTVPLHHVFNRATQDHFYTTDVRARDAVLAGTPSTLDEGVAAHVFTRRICGGVPLYRLYNHGTGAHFYTTDEGEREKALMDDGYDNPAIAGFVLAK
ncbi:hypothetical protein B0H15DRAFT_900495 [Mycena belliarum]|uniref:DUF5648 domain-containing protein n=1 Tax=Mycena belliarum TaxID=1033014 RepID=A0AAD6UHI7_9AGAR|nr:hypothetical protein B0H15DRAFT_900495 [Mycena belliae]